MGDVGQRLAAVLTAEVSSVTATPDLAAGARTRLRRRRRRVAVAGAVAVVLAVAVPTAVMSSGDDRPTRIDGPADTRSPDSGMPTGPPEEEVTDPPAWQVVRLGGARVEVPADWVATPGCEGDQPADSAPAYGPAGGTTCVVGPGAFVLDSVEQVPGRAEDGTVRCTVQDACVFKVVSDEVVFVSGLPRGSSDRVYDSIRPAAGVSSGAWQGASVLGLSLDVPAGWAAAPERCTPVGGAQIGLDQRAFSGIDVCEQERVSVSRGGETAGGRVYEGLGYVVVDGVTVRVDAPHDVVRRVLASVRPAGSPGVDLDTWETRELVQGVTVEVPVDADVSVVVSAGTPRCSGAPPVAERVGDAWRAVHCLNRIVTVTAPTEALAMVVAATVRD
jgi:hypothetical protein